MNKNELKIGNLFDYHGQTVHVMSIGRKIVEFGYFIDSIGFNRLYNGEDFPDSIPLSEEWLLNFGGERDEYGDVFIWMRKENNLRFYLSPDGFIQLTKDFCAPMFNFKHIDKVHLFQNLFYDFVGTELTIQDKTN